ncbi:LacI family transcriptional regulator [Domibacillus sp. PGB-M46]|uniref:LacI family DNA-binding transcriptional regulator n=1 Tax=Domibacillus sp. PGB-M46 TaxID=2910255 RepID=UPI001F581F3F|nr:LacI family DNA-binding transcriptional regulator [Domibacillus sp. PGB-M46]MCI2256064.1 LacI family transcriptional regulator [Domibacillus sp. PGB-M46]
MPTIKDVAQLSGISKTTVSRVINNKGYVSEEKKALVLKAMEELEYHPNLSARRLRGQLTTTIGVIVPKITNPFFSYLVDAIEEAAYEKGYQVLIFQSNEDPKKELAFLNLLKTKQVDGVIMTAVENHWSKVKSFIEHGPIVLCNVYIDKSKVPTVRLNQYKGTYDGIKHLIERGHRKIAYCTGGFFKKEGKGKERNQGYQKALEEAGISINPNWVFVNQHSIEDGQQVLRKILEMDERPTAVFTGSDEVASGMIAEANVRGIQIPDDLAIMGFDDQPIARVVSPKLTTIKQPVDRLGEKAVEIIIEKLNNVESSDEYCELPIELIIRQST